MTLSAIYGAGSAQQWSAFETSFETTKHYDNPFSEVEVNVVFQKGDYTVPAGGSLTLRYRFYFRLGDKKTACVAERSAAYVAGK